MFNKKVKTDKNPTTQNKAKNKLNLILALSDITKKYRGLLRFFTSKIQSKDRPINDLAIIALDKYISMRQDQLRIFKFKITNPNSSSEKRRASNTKFRKLSTSLITNLKNARKRIEYIEQTRNLLYSSSIKNIEECLKEINALKRNRRRSSLSTSAIRANPKTNAKEPEDESEDKSMPEVESKTEKSFKQTYGALFEKLKTDPKDEDITELNISIETEKTSASLDIAYELAFKAIRIFEKHGKRYAELDLENRKNPNTRINPNLRTKTKKYYKLTKRYIDILSKLTEKLNIAGKTYSTNLMFAKHYLNESQYYHHCKEYRKANSKRDKSKSYLDFYGDKTNEDYKIIFDNLNKFLDSDDDYEPSTDEYSNYNEESSDTDEETEFHPNLTRGTRSTHTSAEKKLEKQTTARTTTQITEQSTTQTTEQSTTQTTEQSTTQTTGDLEVNHKKPNEQVSEVMNQGRTEINRLLIEANNYRSFINELLRINVKNEKSINNLRSELCQKNIKINELLNELSQIKINLNTLLDTNDRQKDEIDELNQKNSQAEKLQSEIEALKIEQKKSKQDREKLKKANRLLEKYVVETHTIYKNTINSNDAVIEAMKEGNYTLMNQASKLPNENTILPRSKSSTTDVNNSQKGEQSHEKKKLLASSGLSSKSSSQQSTKPPSKPRSKSSPVLPRKSSSQQSSKPPSKPHSTSSSILSRKSSSQQSSKPPSKPHSTSSSILSRKSSSQQPSKSSSNPHSTSSSQQPSTSSSVLFRKSSSQQSSKPSSKLPSNDLRGTKRDSISSQNNPATAKKTKYQNQPQELNAYAEVISQLNTIAKTTFQLRSSNPRGTKRHTISLQENPAPTKKLKNQNQSQKSNLSPPRLAIPSRKISITSITPPKNSRLTHHVFLGSKKSSTTNISKSSEKSPSLQTTQQNHSTTEISRAPRNLPPSSLRTAQGKSPTTRDNHDTPQTSRQKENTILTPSVNEALRELHFTKSRHQQNNQQNNQQTTMENLKASSKTSFGN